MEPVRSFVSFRAVYSQKENYDGGNVFEKVTNVKMSMVKCSSFSVFMMNRNNKTKKIKENELAGQITRFPLLSRVLYVILFFCTAG